MRGGSSPVTLKTAFRELLPEGDAIDFPSDSILLDTTTMSTGNANLACHRLRHDLV